MGVVLELAETKDILETYKIIKDYAKHEDGLMNVRMTWFLSITTVMFGSLALMIPNVARSPPISLSTTVVPSFPLIAMFICVFGLIVARHSLSGVSAASNALFELQCRWARIAEMVDADYLLPNILGGTALDKSEATYLASGPASDARHHHADTARWYPTWVIKAVIAGWIVVLVAAFASLVSHYNGTPMVPFCSAALPGSCS